MKIQISVPKPCHENWNAMSTAEGGRFCGSCQHTVADLTRTSDAELVALFRRDAMPKCARFDRSQLDRVMSPERPLQRTLPAIALSALVALAVGEAQAQPPMQPGQVKVCTIPSSEVLKGKVKAAPPPPVIGEHIVGDIDVAIGDTVITRVAEPRSITGRVVDGRTGEVLPFASVGVKGTAIGCATDLDGSFELVLPDSLAALPAVTVIFAYIGYERHETLVPLHRTEIRDVPVGTVEVEPPVVVPAMGTGTRNPRELSGRVTDPITQEALSGVRINLKGTPFTATTDANGLFSIHLPDDFIGERIALIATGRDGAVAGTTMSSRQLPFSVPIALRAPIPPEGATVPAVPPAPTPLPIENKPFVNGGTMGLVPLVPMHMVLGMMVPQRLSPTRSAWRSVSQPFRTLGYRLGL